MTTCPGAFPQKSDSARGILVSFNSLSPTCKASKRTLLALMQGVESELERQNFASVSRWEKDLLPFDETVHHFSSMLAAVSLAWRQRDLVRSLLQKRLAVLVKNYGKCPFYGARRSGQRRRDELALQTVIRHGLPPPDLEIVIAQDGLIISARTRKHCELRIKDRCFGVRKGSFSVMFFDDSAHTIEVQRTQSVSQMVQKVVGAIQFLSTVENKDVAPALRKARLSSSTPDLAKEEITLSTPLRERSPSPGSEGSEEYEVDVQLD